MKNLILSLLAFVLVNVANAQQPEIQIANNAGGAGAANCTGDLTIILYAIDASGCNTIVGESNPMPLPASGTNTGALSYSDIATSPGWNTDPGAYVSGTNEWTFGGVKVQNCSSITPGFPTCGGSGINGLTIIDCGTTNDCFEYNTSCPGGCSSGQAIDVNFTSAGGAGVSHLSFFKL